MLISSLIADGYPIVDATRIALETTRSFLEKDDSVCSEFDTPTKANNR